MRPRAQKVRDLTPNRKRDERGVALFASLALLLVFTLIGTSYVQYMSITYDDTRYELTIVRADSLSRGGIYAAIGELQAALASDDPILSEYTLSLPIYRTIGGEREAIPQTVKVTVTDEASRADLNDASPQLLAALGLPENVVSQTRSAKRAGQPRRLVSVDDLRASDFMNGQSFNELDKSLFTVYTGAKGQQSAINLNSASPQLLAAVFAIDLVEANTLAGKRPFTTWDDVRAKVGREPSTFNVNDGVGSGTTMPSSLSLSSRTFRLSSEVEMVVNEGSPRRIRSFVEAVVYIASDGSFAIRYWDQRPMDDVEVVAQEEVVPLESEEGVEPEMESAPVDEGTESE